MERKFYTDDFERLLKEKSDEFRMYPSKRVWSSIYNDLHPGRKWPSVAVSLLLISALLITGYWNSNKNNDTKKTIIAAAYNKPAGATEKNDAVYIAGTATAQQTSSANNNDNSREAATATVAGKTEPASKNTTHPVSNSVSNKTSSAVSIPAQRNSTNATPAVANTSYTKNRTYNQIYNTKKDIEIGNVLNKITTATKVIKVIAEAEAGFSKSNVEEIIASGNGKHTTSSTQSTETTNLVSNNSNTQNAEEYLSSNDKQIAAIAQSGAPAVAATTANGNAAANSKKAISAEDKAWMDDYAMYNKSNRKKWKDRLSKEFYITPGVSFRSFSNNSGYDATSTSNTLAAPSSNNNLNNVLNQKPGIAMEAGMGLIYSLSKKIRIKAGLQVNYSSYVIFAQETNHPVLTTLSLNDINTGYPYLAPRTATLANSPFSNPAKVHNKNYQVSIPIGVAVKLAGNEKLEWYAGASIQPTYVVNGKANVISSDRKYYVSDPSLLRHWSLNSGVETYVSYKLNGFNLQAGPQFRYQVTSTYSTQYTLTENLYNVGLKIGILKNF